jgi:hypothetical protein
MSTHAGLAQSCHQSQVLGHAVRKENRKDHQAGLRWLSQRDDLSGILGGVKMDHLGLQARALQYGCQGAGW